jgi:hypothetical protein
MTPDEIKTRYNVLLERVRRMRGLQVHYKRYRTEDDRKRMVALERLVDNLVSEEVKRKESKQIEIN